jgi:hypothetical protein
MTMTDSRRQAAVPADAAAALAALEPDDFSAFVASSLGHDADPAIWEALTGLAVIYRTKNVLKGLDRDILTQLAQANTELDEVKSRGLALGHAGYQEFADARAEQADWRRRTQGFRRLVLRRLALVQERAAAIAEANRAANPPAAPGTGKMARKHNRAALETLARAVLTHKRAVLSGDGDEGDDEVLWAYLRSVTAMSQRGEMPLAQWLGYLDEVREDDDE